MSELYYVSKISFGDIFFNLYSIPVTQDILFAIIIACFFHDKVSSCNRPISQTVFMLSIAINRAEHVYAAVIIKHNYMLMCNHKIVINIMLCLLNSTGHI